MPGYMLGQIPGMIRFLSALSSRWIVFRAIFFCTFLGAGGLATQAWALPSVPNAAHDSNLFTEAKEGFTAPGYIPVENLQRAWKSVVLVKAQDTNGKALGTGSAFLISLKKSGAVHKGIFLTNTHVVDSLCEVASCDKIRIAYDTALARRNLKFQKGRDAFEKPARIIKTHKPLDLAILEVDLSDSEAAKLEKIPMRAQCTESRGEAVYLIGYPTTFWRPNPTKGTIPQADLVTKRLSSGFVVGIVQQATTTFHTTRVVQTTADAISGNSGGPAVDKDGYFMGAVFNAYSADPKSGVAGDKYFGQEQTLPRYPHSFLVSCPEVFNFLGAE